MNREAVQDVSLETIQNLLRARPKVSMEGDCPHMMTVAMAVAGTGSEEQRQQASDHLATCGVCRDVVLSYQSVDADMTNAPLETDVSPVDDALGRVTRLRLWKPLAYAAAAVVIAAVSFVFYQSQEQEAPADTKMVIKGDRDSLKVGIGRGAARFTAEPHDRLRVGDRLGMFYTAKQPGYLMVVNVDNSGSVSLLYPAGETRSRKIDAGDTVSLPDGAIVREGEGCEWIVAAFSDVPLEVDSVMDAVRSASRQEDLCALEIIIPKARTVRVFPFTR